jgi:hypothetical protein
MKSLTTIVCALLLFSLTITAVGQSHDTICVSVNKKTYLVFDSKVSATETGTDLYEHDATNNIVSVNAINPKAQPTTLMVQTETDLFVWIVQVSPYPNKFLYNFKKSAGPPESPIASANNKPYLTTSNGKGTLGTTAAGTSDRTSNALAMTNRVAASNLSGPEYNTPTIVTHRVQTNNRDSDIKDELIQKRVNWVINNDKISYKDLADIEGGMYFTLFNVFIDQSNIYLKFNITNTSSIAYDVDFLTIEIKHGSKGLRSRESASSQLIEGTARETVKTIFPGTNETIVHAIKLFAFEEKDKIHVKISELGGRRSLEFVIPSKVFTNAKTIPL